MTAEPVTPVRTVTLQRGRPATPAELSRRAPEAGVSADLDEYCGLTAGGVVAAALDLVGPPGS